MQCQKKKRDETDCQARVLISKESLLLNQSVDQTQWIFQPRFSRILLAQPVAVSSRRPDDDSRVLGGAFRVSTI